MAPDPRPPTILSEFGDGYCRVCHFIVGLDAHGLLLVHVRGAHGLVARYGETNPACKGSDRAPTKLTPFTSRLAAFSTKARRDQCPACHQEIVVEHSGRWKVHSPTPGVTGWCKMSQKVYVKPQVNRLKHNGERG